jgi:D-3-phosphoglycerate dehydrogenase
MLRGLVRHLEKPGVLASVLDAVRAAGINVQEMENIIFEGAEAAVARIHLESCPAEEMLGQIGESSPHILEVGMIEL